MSKPQQPEKRQSELTDELIKEWLQQQRLAAENDRAAIELEKERLQSNERLAMKSMEYQSKDIQNRPGQVRKTLKTIAWIVGLVVLMFLSFLGLLLYLGKDEFAYSLLRIGSYIVVSLASYLAGRKTSKKQQISELQDSEFDVIN